MTARKIVLSLSFAACVMHAAHSFAQMPDFDAVEITTTDLGHGIFMLQGFGGNIGVSVGKDGVFVIDDQFAQLAPKVLAAIAELSNKPIDYVINTHWHGDHTGGNAALGNAGAVIVAHDNVRVRLASAPEPPGESALPVVTFSESTTFYYNGHEIHVLHPEIAHTDGDAVIHFRDIDVIHAGDILFNGLYPFIDLDSGGNIDGYLAALERLADLAGPETQIIAGHGPLASKVDVQKSIAMLTDAKRRVAKLIAEGKSLEEVKAADPLSNYHADWAWAFITGERMTEIYYHGLQPAR